MTTLALVDPVAGTVADATLIANNDAAIKAVVNGGIDNNNFAAGKIFDNTKIMQGGATLGQALVWNGTNWVPGTGGPQVIFDVVIGRGQAGDPTSPGNPDSNTILGGNIPQTYKHLRLEIIARSDFAASVDFLGMRFNADSATNYDIQRLRGNAATASAGESLAQSAMMAGLITGASANAGKFAHTIIDIPNYADTTMHKVAVAISAAASAATTGTLYSETYSGHWRSTAAITRIALLPFSGGTGFVTGSRFTLYGMP